jgi:hypothetical protein
MFKFNWQGKAKKEAIYETASFLNEMNRVKIKPPPPQKQTIYLLFPS